MIPASIQNGNGNAMAAKARFLLVLFTILLISLAVFYAISVPHHTVTGHAKNGTLNLTGADFDDEIYALDGEWEFFGDRLYTPEDFARGVSGETLVHVPYGRNDKKTYCYLHPMSD